MGWQSHVITLTVSAAERTRAEVSILMVKGCLFITMHSTLSVNRISSELKQFGWQYEVPSIKNQYIYSQLYWMVPYLIVILVDI